MPVAEDAPLKPQSVYGRTKRTAEDFLRDLTRANANWRIAILRYFNPAGAHPSARIGESPADRPQNLVPLLCKIAGGEIGELAIFGSDWPHIEALPEPLQYLDEVRHLTPDDQRAILATNAEALNRLQPV